MTTTGRKAVTDNSHVSQVLAAGRIHIEAKTDQQVLNPLPSMQTAVTAASIVILFFIPICVPPELTEVFALHFQGLLSNPPTVFES